jgi:hypothetical protein
MAIVFNTNQRIDINFQNKTVSLFIVMKKISSLVFCFFLFLITTAQTTTLFKGTIGTYPVVLQLTTYDTSASATYFYENQKKNIELNGSIQKDGTIIVACYDNYDEQLENKSERLELKLQNNRCIGRWKTANKTLPVNLSIIALNKLKTPIDRYVSIQEIKKETPIDYLRMAGLRFIKDSTIKEKDYWLDWYHEKYSGIHLFRLRKQKMTNALAKVNEELEAIQLLQSNYSLTCTSCYRGTEFDQHIDEVFLDSNFLSINLFTSYDCGGAHPDFGSSGYTFNLNTGTSLELDDLLWFGKNEIPKKDSDEWYDYRSSVFAPALVTLLSQLYPNEMQKPSGEEACDYSDPEVWNFINWYFTDKGLYVGGYFSRAARVCDEPEWSIIPYNVVRKYMNPSLTIKLPE